MDFFAATSGFRWKKNVRVQNDDRTRTGVMHCRSDTTGGGSDDGRWITNRNSGGGRSVIIPVCRDGGRSNHYSRVFFSAITPLL